MLYVLIKLFVYNDNC